VCSLLGFDHETGNCSLHFPVFDAHQIAVWDVDWSPDGKRIVSGDDNTIIYVWEVETMEIVSAWDMQGFLGTFQGVEWPPDGNFITIQGMGVPIPIFRLVHCGGNS